MLAVLFTALSQDLVADSRAAAFDLMLSRPQGYKVTFKATRTDGLTSSGTLQARPNRLDYAVKSGPYDFRYVINPQRAMEIEHSNQTYFESIDPDRIYAPSGSFSDAPDSLPVVFTAGGFGIVFGKSGKQIGKTPVDGQICDQIRFVKSGAPGDPVTTADCWFLSDGRLLKMNYKEESGAGASRTAVYTFSNWGPADSAFEVAPPNSYRMAALPREPWVPYPGTVFPADNWLSATTGKAEVLKPGENTLVLFLQPDCVPTTKVVAALAPLTKKYRTWVFTSGKSAPSAWTKAMRATFFTSQNGDTFGRFYVPGSPFIMVLNKNSQLLHCWYGYDAKTFTEDKAMIEKALITGVSPIAPR